MAKLTAEVIPDPRGSRSWVVEVRFGSDVVKQIAVPSQDVGDALILEMFREIQERAKEEGYLD